jgi:hypothetical protein
MKGVIVHCLSLLVKNQFGEEQWRTILEQSGEKPYRTFLATEDIPDEKAIELLNTTCRVLNLSLQDAADAFGSYWVSQYAPKVYKAYYYGVSSARDFILKMDDIHQSTTKTIPNARPPRFEYHWLDERTLEIRYISHRRLIELLIGLIRGVGEYFREDLVVTRQGDSRVRVEFR